MRCPKCRGKGYLTIVTNFETIEHHHEKCEKCDGTGKASDDKEKSQNPRVDFSSWYDDPKW